MSGKTHALSWQRIFGYSLFGALASLNAAWADVTGGIATDGTMGAVQTLSGANVTVPQSLGTTVDTNLFHSFIEFNIAQGQTVEFIGSDALQNVISRVTGTDVTEIEGTLKSSIANAAFYFINPNGITFGAAAQVDVPGAFHISTADKIDFPNNSGAFYAESRQASTLSSEAPAAFGFLDTSAANNGLIDVNGAHLAVGVGQTLDAVAGEITLENDAAVTASAGEIRLVAMQGAGSVSLEQTADGILPLPDATPSASNAGHIAVNASVVDTIGDGGGRIALWGGNTSFTNSNAFADNSGTTDATSVKGIDIRAYSLSMDNSWITFNALGVGKAGNVSTQARTLDIFNGGQVSSSTFMQGNAGSVLVMADTLTIDGQGSSSGLTGILSDTYTGSGHAGNVTTKAGTLDVLNGGLISSSTYSQGDAGSVVVTADSLTIDSQGNSSVPTGIFSDTSKGSGHAGNVTIKAGTLDVLNGGLVSSSTFTQGDAGSVVVTADSLTIDSQGNSSVPTGIFSTAYTSGQAGSVDIQAGTLDVLNGGQVSSSTRSQGDAGSVVVTADSLTIDSQGKSSILTGIFSDTYTGSGHAGNVTIKAKVLGFLNSGRVSSSTYAQGDAGSVTVTADTLAIDSLGLLSVLPGIFSEAITGSGQAGDVTVRVGKLDIFNRGQVSSSSYTQGAAGSVKVTADTLRIDSQGDSSFNTGISSAALGVGSAGTVTIQAGTLSLNDRANISSDTYAMGSAGTVRVNAETVEVLRESYISSGSWGIGSSGRTGDVTVTASEWLHLADGGQISIKNQAKLSAADAASINPGFITVTAPDIDMKDSRITSISTGNVAAGNIIINFSHWLTMDPSFISTTANTGNGGSIVINGGELIYLQNSGFGTTVIGASSNGGDIFTTADILVMDTGLIQANAVGGSGGNITLNLDALIPSGNTLLLGGSTAAWQPFEPGFNVIQAASQAGVSGTVSVTAPQLNLSGIVANLGGPQFDTSRISQDYCELGTGSSLTRKGAGGLKPKSADQLLF